MKGEIWKDIQGYEGLYQVSNLGRVKSLNYKRTGKERILKPSNNGQGYLRVKLCKDGNREQPLVHRLVATVFCENPEGYTEVNHLDENKQNNMADNLEWCSRQYNVTYNGRAKKAGKKAGKKLSKPVYSINKESGLITYWQSAREAERCTDIPHGNIIKCCKGKYHSAGNHYWFYADDDDNE